MKKYSKIYLLGFLFIAITAVLVGSCKKEENESPFIPPNNLAVGSTAEQLLAGGQFSTLYVDLIYMEGHAPTDAAVEDIESFLNEYLHKPGGIFINLMSIPAGNQSAYSVSDIRAIESQHREHYNTAESMAISFILLDGDYSENTGDAQVLGIAYLNTSMAIFHKTVSENSGGLTQPSRSKLESTILRHEVGHILGLVNNGTPMVVNHQDTGHGHHCNNEDCLMYFATQTTDVIDNLIGNDIPDLDLNCQEDLESNGGK